MADLTFQGIASDANRTARIWQRPMRSPTSHARMAIFSAESPILAKTIAEDIGRIVDRDISFAKMLEQVQAACASISDSNVGVLVGESDGDTLTFHAHGPISCFLAEPAGTGFAVSALPVEPYAPGEPFTYVTGQVGSGIFIAFTNDTSSLVNPETVAAAALDEDGLWQLKRQLESKEGDGAFCIVLGKSGRSVPGAIAPVSHEPSLDSTESHDEVGLLEVDAVATVGDAVDEALAAHEETADLFAAPPALTDAIDGMQNWAKDTRAQFTESMKKASTYDPRSFFRKMGNAFAAGKMSSVAAHSTSVAGERSSRAKNFSRNAMNRFLSMPRNLQVASAGLVACIILFLIGLGVAPMLGYGRANAHTDRELVAISSLLDDAQSNLVYKNEDRATSLVQEANARLATLSADAPLFKNKEITRRNNELQSRIATMRTELRKAVAVSTTDRILVSGANGITSLAGLGKDLYAARGNEMLRWDTAEGLFETVTTLTGVGTSIIADDEDALLVERIDNDTLAVVNAKTYKAAAGPRVGATMNVLASYGGRYYGVDMARGVVRITDSGTQAWLKSPVAMVDPRGITVDGDVYVALPNEIKKYRTGNAATFTPGMLDPTMADIKGLVTTADSSFLYILDQGGNRLLALNKNGKLAKQYELPQGQAATSFAVSEANKSAYLLIGSTVITVPLSHL